MTVWGLIGQSYALPFQRFGDTMRVFWPAAVLWVVVGIANEYFSHLIGAASYGLKEWSGLLLLFMCWLYQSFVMASGLIRWHQYVIKGLGPEAARLWLLPDEWRFWLGWFLLGTMIYATLVAFMLGIAELAVNPHHVEASDLQRAKLFALQYCVAFILAMATITAIFPRAFLSLAAVAVRDIERHDQFAGKPLSRADYRLLVFAALATSVPPFFLGTLWPSTAPERVLGEASTIVGIVNALYSELAWAIDFAAFIVFATMLSLFYRERFPEGVQAASAP